MVFQRGQINRTFWVLIPCFRVNPSVERYFSIKCLSKFKVCYPRSSKNARWTDSPLKASVCSRLKPRMAWLFTFQNSSFSVFHQTIHCLIVLEESHLCQWYWLKEQHECCTRCVLCQSPDHELRDLLPCVLLVVGGEGSKALVLTVVAAISSGVSVISSVTALGLTLVIGICGTWVHARFVKIDAFWSLTFLSGDFPIRRSFVCLQQKHLSPIEY